MGVKLCQACREVRFEAGLSWCGLHQRDFPDAEQCARFQPEPGLRPPVGAETGIDLPWIAFADCVQ